MTLQSQFKFTILTSRSCKGFALPVSLIYHISHLCIIQCNYKGTSWKVLAFPQAGRTASQEFPQASALGIISDFTLRNSLKTALPALRKASTSLLFSLQYISLTFISQLAQHLSVNLEEHLRHTLRYS